MSYEAAIGQVEQILQWQQQLLDPAAAAPGTATAASGSSSESEDPAFAAALAEAQGSTAEQATGIGGTDSGTALGGGLLGGGDSQLLSLLSSLGASGSSSADSLGTTASGGDAEATDALDPRVTAMIDRADSLLGKPYVWGGGHDGWGAQSGYDCSGFVSAVLHAGGYLSQPQDTETLPSAAGIESGPGRYVTIYDRNESGEEGHVIIEIDGQFYESGGAHGAWGGGGGVEKIATPSAAYLSTFNDVLHPAGL